MLETGVHQSESNFALSFQRNLLLSEYCIKAVLETGANSWVSLSFQSARIQPVFSRQILLQYCNQGRSRSSKDEKRRTALAEPTALSAECCAQPQAAVCRVVVGGWGWGVRCSPRIVPCGVATLALTKGMMRAAIQLYVDNMRKMAIAVQLSAGTAVPGTCPGALVVVLYAMLWPTPQRRAGRIASSPCPHLSRWSSAQRLGRPSPRGCRLSPPPPSLRCSRPVAGHPGGWHPSASLAAGPR